LHYCSAGHFCLDAFYNILFFLGLITIYSTNSLFSIYYFLVEAHPLIPSFGGVAAPTANFVQEDEPEGRCRGG